MKISDIYIHATSAVWLEREVAFAIDVIICLTLTIFPTVGWVLGLAYFMCKDALPFTNSSSLGKIIYGLKAVNINTEERLTLEKSIIRSIILIVPILNIFDIYHFLKTGVRLADKWTESKVVSEYN